MKTAGELFNKTLGGSEFKSYPDGLMDESQFKKALKEHNKEIIQIIDDMIGKYWTRKNIPTPNIKLRKQLYKKYENKINTLTELKERYEDEM